jgi:hypothetical protein
MTKKRAARKAYHEKGRNESKDEDERTGEITNAMNQGISFAHVCSAPTAPREPASVIWIVVAVLQKL